MLRLMSAIGPAFPPYSSGSISLGTNSFNESNDECTWIYLEGTEN